MAIDVVLFDYSGVTGATSIGMPGLHCTADTDLRVALAEILGPGLDR